MSMSANENSFFLSGDHLSPAARAKKERLEQDPAAIALICHEVQNSAPDYHYSKIAARLDALGIILT